MARTYFFILVMKVSGIKNPVLLQLDSFNDCKISIQAVVESVLSKIYLLGLAVGIYFKLCSSEGMIMSLALIVAQR